MTNKNKVLQISNRFASAAIMIIILLLLSVATLLMTALLSYSPSDPAWSQNNGGVTTNLLGTFGAWYSDLSFSLIGKLSYLLPIAFAVFAIQLWLEKKADKEVFSWRLFMILTAVLSGCVLWTKHDLQSINMVAQTGGGALGAWLVIGLEKSVKSIPVIMAFSLVIFTASLSILCNIPWPRIFEWIGKGISAIFALMFSGLVNRTKKTKKTDTNRKTVPTSYFAKERNFVKEENFDNNDNLEKESFSISDDEIDIQAPFSQPEANFQSNRQPPKPRFTIERYEGEEDNAFVENSSLNSTTIENMAFDELPTFSQRGEESVSEPIANSMADTFHVETKEKAQPEPMVDSNGIEHKAEPSFFDFSHLGHSETSENNHSKKEILEETVKSYSKASIMEKPMESSAREMPQSSTTADAHGNHDNNQSFNAHSAHREASFVERQKPAKITSTVSRQLSRDDIFPEQQEVPEKQLVQPSVQEEVRAKNTATPFEFSFLDNTIDADETKEKAASNVLDMTATEEPSKAFEIDISPASEFVQEPEISQAIPETVSEFVSEPVSEPAPEAVPQPTQTASTATIPSSSVASSVTIGKAYDKNSEPEPVVTKSYELPNIGLLDEPPAQVNAYTEDTLAEMARILEHTLKQFNVDATVMHVSPGPVITRFEIDLAPGIQAKKITSLSVDLARALAVSGVRVEEVIPGSSYVGLEVPNKQRQIVYFKDVVRSSVFQKSPSPLTISLGSDTSGKPIVADLMKMPHALVAGTTGSGKSVCINVMLLSMLFKATPKDLRLILVDPKMLEMSMYEDIPHLLTPVITDMNEAENALTWAVAEMERRYQLMAALKVRKIDAFNQHIDEANAKGEPIKDPLWEPNESVGYTHHPNLERLPFIVIVIDELADMMMVVGKQVEQLIARLTQKARAAGIHVVLATQRPSTDVLTGLIKANVPTRIAFQVSSGTDSRVIIDSVGAEKLLGHGDMLFVPPGAGHPQRLHGAFVGDAETDRITNFLRETGEPDYIEGITSKQAPETLGAFGAAEAGAKEDADPLYEEAIEIVLTTGKASISSVQRQLRIGYNRAARMIEDMQAQGIVSEPVNGVRKVLGAPRPK